MLMLQLPAADSVPLVENQADRHTHTAWKKEESNEEV